MPIKVWIPVWIMAVLTLAGPSSFSSASIIADFNDDFQSPTPSAGWAYLYNGTNKTVGDSSGYVSLVWCAGQNKYRSNANYPSTWTRPAANAGVGANYVSTALGAAEGSWSEENPRLDHYTILAYTIQAGEAGIVSIVNSTVSVNAQSWQSGVDMDLKVYVNDTLKYSLDTLVKYVEGAGDNVVSNTFDVAMGQLNVGDTVYVCLGPKGNSYRDYTATFDFSLDMVPEPTTVILLGLGVLGLKLRKTRTYC